MPSLDPVFVWFASASSALLFMASGLMKLRDIEMFRGAVANYQLLPEWAEALFSYLIPIVEVGSALGLFFHRTHFWAGTILILLLWMFSFAILVNLLRGRVDIDCGCFGLALRQTLSGWLLVRNAVLIMLMAAALPPAADRPLGWPDVLTIVFATATTVILYAGANYLLANAPRLRTFGALHA